MNCEFCNKKIEENSLFCTFCGKNVQKRLEKEELSLPIKKIVSKKRILHITLVLFILTMVGMSFYWFQYLPKQQRIDCHENSLKDNNYEIAYKKCLRSKGFKN